MSPDELTRFKNQACELGLVPGSWEWAKLFEEELVRIYIRSNGPKFGGQCLLDQLSLLRGSPFAWAIERIGWAAVLGKRRTPSNSEFDDVVYDINTDPCWVTSNEELRFAPTSAQLPLRRCLGVFGVIHHSRFKEYLLEQNLRSTKDGIYYTRGSEPVIASSALGMASPVP